MQNFTRRDFLKFASVGTTALALAACAAPGAAPAGGEAGAAAPGAEALLVTLVESWFGVPQFKESIDPITDALSKKMQEEGLNITLQSMILEDHNNKYPALYASGADFTMAFDAPWNKRNTLRDQGALAEIETLMDAHGPQLKEEVTEKIYNANFTNGHLYGIPTAYYYGGTGGVMFREDLRQKYGAEMPTSAGGWPSLEAYLTAIQTNEPDLIPFVNVATQSLVSYHRQARRGWGGIGFNDTGVVIPDATADWQLVDEEDVESTIEAANLLRAWWEKGLINKTDLPFSGESQNSQIDYIYPGRGAACVENEPDYKWVDQTKQMKSSNPDAMLLGVDMLGARSGDVRLVGALKQWNFIVFNANAPVEKQQAGIEFFNWLAGSQDNMDLWLMGIDGVNYNKADNLRFTEVEGVDAARNYRRQWYVSGISGRFQRQPADLPPEAEEALAFFTTESNWDFNPYEQFEADTKALEVDAAKLGAVYLEASHGFTTGQLPTEEARAQMKKLLDDAGRQDYKAKLQAQLDEFIKAQG